MKPGWLAGYSIILVTGWAILAAAGAYYAWLKSIPLPIALPLIGAFLVEYAFYLIPGFERLRNRLADRIPVLWFATLIALSGLAPYLIYSLPTGMFRIDPFLRLTLLLVAIAFWYVFREPSKTSDIAMLVLLGAMLLSKVFTRIYLSPAPGVRIDILGQLMLIRVAALVMLSIREVEGVGFGFLPTAREWKIGFRWFLLFLPIGLPIALALGLFRFDPSSKDALFAPLVFLGFLWVTGLAEEFFFRGLVQQWLARWTGRTALALIATSIVFGLCHLSYGDFPNWKFALVAGVAAWFYGKAFEAAGGIRAATVTHALVVTFWRTLFA